MKTKEQLLDQMTGMSQNMRRLAFDMALRAGSQGAHLGGGLSIMEIMAVLYGGVMKFEAGNPKWAGRDRFILSKGHGVLAYYSALAEAGFFPAAELEAFETDEGPFGGHPVVNLEKGIEFSSGSLGMGLSFGIGIALTRKPDNDFNVYVLLGDGECNEGSVWEAAMSAGHYQLGNLVAIIDRNNLQYDGSNDKVMDLMNFADKWRAFGWEAVEVDGHDIAQLYEAFVNPNRDPHKPYVVIANTVKGKGVSFMENQRDWHHSRLTQAQYEQAIAELEALPTTAKGDWT